MQQKSVKFTEVCEEIENTLFTSGDNRLLPPQGEAILALYAREYPSPSVIPFFMLHLLIKLGRKTSNSVIVLPLRRFLPGYVRGGKRRFSGTTA